MKKIAIIGHTGSVGAQVYRYFKEKAHPMMGLSIDSQTHDWEEINEYADFVFICVPTPYVWKQRVYDLSILNEVLYKLNKKVVVIKSTIPPGTTEKLQEKYTALSLLFNPEFLSEATAREDFINPDRQLVGYTDKSRKYSMEILNLLPESPYGVIMKASEAEITKYVNNFHGALMVIFANFFYDVCEKTGADFEAVKKAGQASKWVGSPMGRMYWEVFHKGKRGYGGKCLLPKTRIFTEGGSKEIKDIVIGDRVITHNGRTSLVSNTFKRKVDEDIYVINPQGFEPFAITSGHPVLTVQANRKNYGKRNKLSNFIGDYGSMKPVWVDSDELKRGDFLVFPKIKFGDNYLDKEMARLLGYYVAEGSISKIKNRISFALHKKETKIADDIGKIVFKVFGINCHTYRQKNGNGMVVRCSSKELKKFLEDNSGKFSYKKRLSRMIMNSSSSMLKEFLRGYYLGDGSKSTGVYTMATVSKELFYQLQSILFRFGIGFTSKTVSKRIGGDGTKHRESYWIRIRNYVEIKKFGKVVNDPIKKDLKLVRKTSWFDNKFLYVPIRSIDTAYYSGYVYNLEVEKENTFVTSSGIVHNCFPKDIDSLIKWCKENNVDTEIIEATRKANVRILKSQGLTEQKAEKK